MHSMDSSPDWSESRAQEVIQWGAELYCEIFTSASSKPTFPPNHLYTEGAIVMKDFPV